MLFDRRCTGRWAANSPTADCWSVSGGAPPVGDSTEAGWDGAGCASDGSVNIVSWYHDVTNWPRSLINICMNATWLPQVNIFSLFINVDLISMKQL